MKLINKILKKSDPEPPSRITSDNVTEHRERVLAGGRKFKYPIQYVKHKLVINAILISIATLILVGVVGWWQLYVVQNTSDFMYRVTKVVSVPVANIDGQFVNFSDYLAKYRSSVQYLEKHEQVDLSSEDGKKQSDYIKRQSLKDAIIDAYAAKLARDLKISVSDVDIEGFLKSQRQSSDGEISAETQESVIKDYYGWGPDEYRYIVGVKLLRQKVAYEIDSKAKSVSENVGTELSKNKDYSFKDLAANVSSSSGLQVTYGNSGWVSKYNQDGGLAVESSKLSKSQISGPLKSTIGDGYYFVRLLDMNDTQVSYEYIQIPINKLNNDAENLIKDNKIQTYIPVKLQ